MFTRLSLKEIEKADAILILGEDLTNTAPMAALAVRQAARVIPIETGVKTGIPQWHDRAQRTIAQDNKSPLFIANPYQTKLDELAQSVFYTTPDKIAELGFSVASKLSDKAPQLKKTDDSMEKLGTEIASALKNARNPLIISGIHSGNLHLLQAAANVASALRESGKNASLSFILPEANSMGLAMMDGKPIGKALDRIAGGEVDTVIILENDLYKRAEKEKIDRLLGKCRNVIVLDHTMNNTTDKADILMPVGTFAESAGTLVNNEGRAQRYYRVLAPDKSEKESWQVLHDLMMISGKNESLKWNSFDELDAIMTATIPVFALIPDHIPSADFRMLNEKIRRQNPRFSGRTSMSANINVSEPKPPDDPDSPLAFTMEGANETPPSSLVPFYWSAGWNSPQSMNFYLNEPNGSMKGGDPGVRLIETNEKATISYFEPDVKLHESKTGEWLIIPVYQIFGSEEMSSKAQAVAERISDPFVLLNKKDLAGLGFSESDSVTIQVQDENIEVKIKTDEKIPQGIAGISVGLPGIPFLDLPKAGIFGKADVNGKQTKKTTL